MGNEYVQGGDMIDELFCGIVVFCGSDDTHRWGVILSHHDGRVPSCCLFSCRLHFSMHRGR